MTRPNAADGRWDEGSGAWIGKNYSAFSRWRNNSLGHLTFCATVFFNPDIGFNAYFSV